jgi:hypothetical protein
LWGGMPRSSRPAVKRRYSRYSVSGTFIKWGDQETGRLPVDPSSWVLVLIS